MTFKTIKVYTDGACKGNPGPGGWGAILMFQQHERILSGAEKITTNNRMELTAAIKALEALNQTCAVELFTDSQYLRLGMTQWLAGWKKNGWKTANRAPVKNSDLWQALDTLSTQHHVQWHWVKGHAGHPENERADEIANQAIIDFLAGQTL